MAIRAVAFDIGGVLERVGDADVWLDVWRARLRLESGDFDDRMAQVDPRGLIGTGKMTEGEFRRGCLDAFGFSDAAADEFMADMWDWYCGELDTELVDYLRGLRPAYTTGIISNSADGARREEQLRWQFEQLVDEIVYSHEVGVAKPDRRIYELACERLDVAPHELVFLDDVQACVDGASAVGIHALLHRSTLESITAINALLA
ncbi:MAG: HAD family phosphatase [Nocardioidaceae bacterium]